MSRALLVLVLLLGAGCSTVIGEPCKDDGDCNEGSAYCARVRVCTRACGEADPCPGGTTCSRQGPRQVCLRACTRPSQCKGGQRCDTAAGVCVVEDPLAPAGSEPL